jgi:hypothetical protein
MTDQPNNPNMDRFMMFHVQKCMGFWLKSMKSSWNPKKVADFNILLIISLLGP